MNSIVFQQFLEQLKAKDSAKAQGFDLGWYDRMSPAELQEAERLLLEQARTGDGSPIPSLAKLATPEAVAFLEQTLQEHKYYPESGLDYDLSKYLWDITKDEKYLKVFDAFSLKNETAKTSYLKYLADLPDTTKRINQLILFVKDDFEDSAVRAGLEILKMLGLVKKDETDRGKYMPLLLSLRSNDADERHKAQKELNKIIGLYHKSL